MNKLFKMVARFLSSPDAGWKVATFFLVAFSLILVWGAAVLETSLEVSQSKVQLLERWRVEDAARISSLTDRAILAEISAQRIGVDLDMSTYPPTISK